MKGCEYSPCAFVVHCPKFISKPVIVESRKVLHKIFSSSLVHKYQTRVEVAGSQISRKSRLLKTYQFEKHLLEQNKRASSGDKIKQAGLETDQTALTALLACVLCFVPATSAYFSECVFALATNSSNQTNKAGSTCHSTEYFLICLWA